MNDHFRAFIKLRAEELGLSYRQIAKKTGKSSSTISKYMLGDIKDFKVDTFIELAKALKLHPSQLMLAYLGYNFEPMPIWEVDRKLKRKPVSTEPQ